MKVAARAIALPQVSAMISSVNACVSVSIPLLTKIRRGKFSRSKLGSNLMRVSLLVTILN